MQNFNSLVNFLKEKSRTADEIADFRSRYPVEDSMRPTAEYVVNLYEQELVRNEQELVRREQELVRHEQELVRDGKFFSRIDQVFEKDGDAPVNPISEYLNHFIDDNKEFYKNCCRPANRHQSSSNNNESKSKKQKIATDGTKCKTRSMNNDGNPACKDPYMITLEAAENPDNEIVDANNRSSSHNSKKKGIWPKSVFGGDSLNTAQIAHLVPHSRANAESHWFVAEFLFGCSDVNADVDDQQWQKIKRLLHGSQNNSKRINNSGIKHMVTNKVMMHNQFFYFDSNPSVIIVPILSRDGALNWNGDAYEAIALIDSFPCSENDSIGLGSDTTENSPTFGVGETCAEVQFHLGIKEEASNDQVETAHRLLQDYTRAIAYAQQCRKPKALEETFQLTGEWLFFPPKIPADLNSLKVRKIRFDSNEGNECHPAPDPLLLVTKAVVNLQKRHGFELTAAAEPQDGYLYLPSEYSIHAEEEYLRERQENMQHRNPIGFEVIMNAH